MPDKEDNEEPGPRTKAASIKYRAFQKRRFDFSEPISNELNMKKLYHIYTNPLYSQEHH